MFEKENLKIGEARYANSAEDSIIVLFWDDNDPKKEVMEMEVEKNPEDAYYKSLVERGWTEEKLHQATAAWKLAQVRQINEIVNIQVQEKVKLYEEKINREFIDRLEKSELKLSDEFTKRVKQQDAEFQTKMEALVTETFMQNTDPDSLFKFKLAVFEVPQIKDAPMEFKTRVRKAKSIIECYAIINEVYKDESK